MSDKTCDASALFSKQERGGGGLFFIVQATMIKFIRIRLQTRLWLRATVTLVYDDYSQTDFISHDFTLPSAGLLLPIVQKHLNTW